ncbi:alpha/beta fold hydrolase [Rivularia sp. UHCC 0363]|uniref:alpha/beta fold hydrolase n=1 Tax=Rivularia sp. UHCC 0363 TaxID=3110244 RepID=UPI002B200289|nr:alpha/beta fold hydrolase [Rivularia sp. UHCC 0363]MEA5596090.1 alpha/beta fold hydrolase [Rivularia sp. UHCC 0363]
MTSTTVNYTEVQAELITFINKEILESEDSGLDIDTPLLAIGILDSLAMVSLIAKIEDTFGVRVPDDAVTPDNFQSVAAIAQMVDLRQQTNTESSIESPKDPYIKSLTDSLKMLESTGITRHKLDLPQQQGELHYLQVTGNTDYSYVFLPGVGNPSSSWGNILQILNGEQTAIAIDLLGFGLSSIDNDSPNYADNIQAVLTLLETQEIPQPWVLVGSSAGAIIGAEISRLKPQLVKALVITGFGFIQNPTTWWEYLMDLSESPQKFMEAAYYRSPKLTKSLRLLIDGVLSRPAYQSFLNEGGFEFMQSCFEDIKVPTLIVAGEEDQIIPKVDVIKLSEKMPNVKLDWLARCGHFPPSEQPQELLFLIENFLKHDCFLSS